MFTFPTRLANAWSAESFEINLPGYSLDRKSLDISVRTGSTHLPVRIRNPRRLLRKWLGSPLDVGKRYVFEARFDTDANIGHVLFNIAPAVLHAKQMFEGLSVVLRANATPLARNAYKLLGIPIICTDQPVSGNIVRGECGEGVYEPWYRQLFGRFEFEGYVRDTPERVFISRRGTRRLVNEGEVEDTLRKYGFQKFYFEEIPLAQQWSIARNAKVVAAINGAAFSSIVFNRSGVRVLELFHPGYVTTIHRHLTNAVGGTWCGVTGQMPPNLVRELDKKQRIQYFAWSAIRIDLHSLARGLEHLNVT